MKRRVVVVVIKVVVVVVVALIVVGDVDGVVVVVKVSFSQTDFKGVSIESIKSFEMLLNIKLSLSGPDLISLRSLSWIRAVGHKQILPTFN